MDLNDNPPIFDPSIYVVSVAEDATVGTIVTQLAVSDKDSNNNKVLSYSIDSGNAGNSFSLIKVNDNSVQVVTINTLNRELFPQYVMIIRATDGGASSLFGTATLTIAVDDLNDNAPSVTSPAPVSVFENTTVGTSLFDVDASDLDVGVNALLSYSITFGNSGGWFSIVGSTGEVILAKTLDRETTPVHVITITVSDTGTPVRSSSVTGTVSILDINDNAPLFATNYTFVIQENIPPNSTVGQVIATDKDTGYNAIISYTIMSVSTGIGRFYIESDSGYIRVGDTIDREVHPIHVIQVRAKNLDMPHFYADTFVRVNVTDVNDNAPKFNVS